MKRLFRSDELQLQFEQNGFVKINLLNKVQVNELLGNYKTVAAEHERLGLPYITTSHSNNHDLIGRVDEMLQRVMAPELDKVLCGHKLLFGNFLVKMTGDNSETEPHQDITFVDEEKFCSVNVWVALQETTVENGCMYFLRGSQNYMRTIRPTHNYTWAYENVKKEIKELADVFPAKEGDAFIFNHAVVHGSFPNKTNKPRIAAVIAAYHADAPLIHYYLPDPNKNVLKKYSMNKEAYLHFVKQQPPAKGIFIGEEVFGFNPLSAEDFKQLTQKKLGA